MKFHIPVISSIFYAADAEVRHFASYEITALRQLLFPSHSGSSSSAASGPAVPLFLSSCARRIMQRQPSLLHLLAHSPLWHKSSDLFIHPHQHSKTFCLAHYEAVFSSGVTAPGHQRFTQNYVSRFKGTVVLRMGWGGEGGLGPLSGVEKHCVNFKRQVFFCERPRVHTKTLKYFRQRYA